MGFGGFCIFGFFSDSYTGMFCVILCYPEIMCIVIIGDGRVREIVFFVHYTTFRSTYRLYQSYLKRLKTETKSIGKVSDPDIIKTMFNLSNLKFWSRTAAHLVEQVVPGVVYKDVSGKWTSINSP